MIAGSFLHFDGIGKKNAEKLLLSGFHSWTDIIDRKAELPFSERINSKILAGAEASLEALEREDLFYFAEKIHPSEKWRMLATYIDSSSYFDIETTAETYGDNITVIVCYHKGKLYKYINGENLHEFLDLLDDIKLLVSFNGASFDVPMILRYYHIPKIPCAHLDLRWVTYYNGYKGGLKQIEKTMNIIRPADILGISGWEAILLWQEWDYNRTLEAKNLLVRYCSADVLSLKMIAFQLLKERGIHLHCPAQEEIWKMLG